MKTRMAVNELFYIDSTWEKNIIHESTRKDIVPDILRSQLVVILEYFLLKITLI